MQLHAYLFLFIITTDKTLALSHHHCGGNLSLEQKAAGHINLTLPGLYTDTNINQTNNQPDKNLSLCTWLINIPPGRTVHLKFVQLEGGSRISVRCVWTKEDHEQVLENGGIALLSGCDRNKATLTWTGSGPSSIQLVYFVQEDERNSTEDRTTRQPDRVLISQTGTSFTRTAPVSQDVERGKEGGRGRLHEGLEWSHGPQSGSEPSSQDLGPPHPTTPLQGLAVAGRADRETLPLPEEGPNNGADTSGTVHITDSPKSAREGTHPYFHTRHTLSTDTSNTVNMETKSSDELTLTQMTLTDATASNSNTTLTTDIHKYTVTHTYKHVTTQAPPTVSSLSISPLTSSLPELPSQTTRKSGTVLPANGGAVSEEKQPHSSRSTGTFNSDLTSGVTFDPFKSHTKPPQDDSSSANTETEASASASSSLGPSTAESSTTHITEFLTGVGAVTAAALHPNTSGTDSFESTTSDVASQTAAFESSDGFDSTTKLHTPTSSTQGQTNSLQSTESLRHSTHASTGFAETSKDSQTVTQSTQRNFRTLGEVFNTSADTGTTAKPYRLHPTRIHPSTNSQTPLPPLPSSTSIHPSTPSYTPQTHTVLSDSSHTTHTPLPLTPSSTVSAAQTAVINHKTVPVPSQTSRTKPTPSHTPSHLLPLSPATPKQLPDYITTTHISLFSLTTAKSREVEKGDDSWQWFPSSTTTHSPTTGPPPPPWPTARPSQETPTSADSTSTLLRSSTTTSQPPKFYIVPDQPAAIKEETIKLLLQIILEDSATAPGLEEDAAAWVGPYLQKAPGFSRLLGTWSSGHAVQNLVEFKTSGALQWLSTTGSRSLLERTGLAQAVREAKSFSSSKITNITLGGQQGEVCDWLLQCPSGYKCVSQRGLANYSCSSLCHFDHCHHHGICTHHPGQLPVCRCLVGEDFWYMGRRCDVRMTRARLVGACLAILLIVVTVIGLLAIVAVRRYRAILIQAKVDQTRSSYRRFNHFDELSGRFWLRSWAGSADSLDNPAFTRSDELLHLRALDRPCCYHDDTLSLASTCPSHGARINTIYPHSSQYAWRGSEMSMGDGVLDSGKASDLSVCSWPVEPIQWTPFPLLQQLASHRTPKVRVSRPRSYCEGMELVDLEKSWTA